VVEVKRSFSGKQGAAAYWLALAYRETGRTDSSAWALRRGTQAFLKQGDFDAQLFDARLVQMMDERDEVQARAAELFLQLLRRVGTDCTPRSLSVLQKHVAQLAPLLSDETLRTRVVRGDDFDPEDWTFREGAGAWLTAWWRRQDPVPTTEKNERLREHLQRVSMATENFASQRRVAKWDDRGEVFVRYGPPEHRHSVKFHDVGFLREVARSGVGVSYSDFPSNEVWKYPTLSSSGKYLFVKDGRDGTYRLATAIDLLPDPLRGPFGPGDRQQNVAYSSMAALRYIYNQLPPHYPDEGNVSSRLNGWFSYQESRRGLSSLSEGSSGREIGFGPGARRVFGGNGPTKGYPSTAATTNISDIKHQERQFFRRRTRKMPRVHSPAGQVGQRLPVEYRVARFLGREGTTRTEVYWGGRTGPFADADSSSRVGMTIVRHDSQYRRLDQVSRGYTGDQIVGDGWEGTVPQRMVVNGVRDTYHLSLQWDWHSREKPRRPAGQRLGMFVARVDTLQSLRAEASELEMSDLRLMSVPPSARDERGSILQKTVPYPYDTVPAQTPLFLYFEIYHLGQSEQGQTRYTVTYEARRQTRKGFLGRLFGDDTQTEVTSTTAEYTGRKRRTEEYLQLDLETDPKRPQPTQVTVRVTDNVTGNEIERSISLTLTPSEGGR
jgi:GWxTD domain-containing protein